MRKPGNCFRFIAKAFEFRGSNPASFAVHFQRYIPLESEVTGLVNHAHAASAHLGNEFITG